MISERSPHETYEYYVVAVSPETYQQSDPSNTVKVTIEPQPDDQLPPPDENTGDNGQNGDGTNGQDPNQGGGFDHGQGNVDQGSGQDQGNGNNSSGTNGNGNHGNNGNNSGSNDHSNGNGNGNGKGSGNGQQGGNDGSGFGNGDSGGVTVPPDGGDGSTTDQGSIESFQTPDNTIVPIQNESNNP